MGVDLYDCCIMYQCLYWNFAAFDEETGVCIGMRGCIGWRT